MDAKVIFGADAQILKSVDLSLRPNAKPILALAAYLNQLQRASSCDRPDRLMGYERGWREVRPQRGYNFRSRAFTHRRALA